MLQSFVFPNTAAHRPSATNTARTLEEAIQQTSGNANFTFDRTRRYFTSITCNTNATIITIDGTTPSGTNGVVLATEQLINDLPINPWDIRILRSGSSDALLSVFVNEVVQMHTADKSLYYEGILFPAKQFVVTNSSASLENRIATVSTGYTLPFTPDSRQFFLFQTGTANGSFTVTNDGTAASATNGRLVPVSEIFSVWGNANFIRLFRAGTADATVNVQAVTFPAA
jgi:hypothetical protein